MVLSILTTAAFGWAIQTKIHLAATLVITFFAGVGATGVFNVSLLLSSQCTLVLPRAKYLQTCLTLNVDLNPDETGFASVAASVVRCLAAAIGVVIMQPLFDSIVVGWAFTIYAALASLAIPMLLVLRNLGPRWRKVPGF